MERGFTLWFTGLSGSGKTTLAQLVEHTLQERGRQVELLEDDHQAVIAPQPADLQPGTHAVLCIQASRLDLAGPLGLAP